MFKFLDSRSKCLGISGNWYVGFFWTRSVIFRPRLALTRIADPIAHSGWPLLSGIRFCKMYIKNTGISVKDLVLHTFMKTYLWLERKWVRKFPPTPLHFSLLAYKLIILSSSHWNVLSEVLIAVHLDGTCGKHRNAALEQIKPPIDRSSWSAANFMLNLVPMEWINACWWSSVYQICIFQAHLQPAFACLLWNFTSLLACWLTWGTIKEFLVRIISLACLASVTPAS